MEPKQICLIQQEIYRFKEFNLIQNIDNLMQYFEWADLAITNTGQTRYELAASGVPFIICPFNNMGYEVSKIFQDTGAAFLEKYNKSCLGLQSLDVLFKFLEDQLKLFQMSENGKKHFFTLNGSDNLVKNLIKVWK